MLFLSTTLFIIYLVYLIYEYYYNKKIKKSFKKIILVNGIRGKTSTALKIDSILRENNYRVYTKTTGTDPIILDCNSNKIPIVRKGSPNILEQIKIIKKAYKEKAEILILECMAINPDLQLISQERIIKSDILVITNIRPDHIPDMGKDLDDIAFAISRTIPENGLVFTADKKYFKNFKKVSKNKDSKITLVENSEFNNEKLACETCKSLIKNYKKTKGKTLEYFNNIENKKYIMKNNKGENIVFINLFSANDPISTNYWIKKYTNNSCNKKYLLYNNRQDRPNRILLFAKHFKYFNNFDKIFICGENKHLAYRLLTKNISINIEKKKDMDFIFNLEKHSIIFGIGNIKGQGYKFIQKLNTGVHNE